MAVPDERIVIEILQQFRTSGGSVAIGDIVSMRKQLKELGKDQGAATEAHKRSAAVIQAWDKDVYNAARSVNNFTRDIERGVQKSNIQWQNFDKNRDILRKFTAEMDDAGAHVLGFGKSVEQAAVAHERGTKKIIENTRKTNSVLRESRNFTDENSGAMRRLAREFDRVTSTTGRKAISGFRAWATTLLSIVPPAIPIALNAVSNAIDVVGGAAVQGVASLRDFAGGVGVMGSAITGVLQTVGALQLGMNNLGSTSQSLGKVFQTSLSESGQDFLNSLKTLPPQAAKFASTVRQEVFPVIHRWRQEMQGILFPSFQDAFKNLGPLFKGKNSPLESAFTGMGRVIASTIRSVSKEFGSKPWQEFIRFQGGENTRNFSQLSTAIIPLANAFRQLTTAAAPVTRYLVDGATSAAKTFAHFINLRSETGKLTQDAARSKTAFHTFFDTLKNVGRIILDVTRVAQPFGRNMVKGFDDATAAAARWTHSVGGQERIAKFFRDIQPNIKETALLFRDLAGAILQASSDKSLGLMLENLRTQVLPAIVGAMRAVNQSGFLKPFIESLTNLLQIMANATRPNGVGYVFIHILSQITNILSMFSGTVGGRAVIGALALYRVLRLIGLIKLGRLVADWVGLSEGVASRTQRMDAALVRANTGTTQFADTTKGKLRQAREEWKGMAKQAQASAADIAKAAEIARVSSRIEVFQSRGERLGTAPLPPMVLPSNFTGQYVPGAMQNRDLVTAGTATARQSRSFLRGVGIEAFQGVPVAQMRAADVKVATAAILKAEEEFLAKTSSETAASILKSSGAGIAEIKAVAAVQVARIRDALVETAQLSGGTMAAEIASAPIKPRGFVPYAQRTAENIRNSPLYASQAGRFAETRAAFAGAREAGAGRFSAFRTAASTFRAGGTGMGLGFGLPIAASLLGTAIGGRTGNALTGIGTGAGVGFLTAGPWGALVGGLAGAALSLGLFKHGVDLTAQSISRMKGAVETSRAARQQVPYTRSELQVAAIDRRDTRKAALDAAAARNRFVDQARGAGMSQAQIHKNPIFRQLNDQVVETRQAFLTANATWIQARQSFQQVLGRTNADVRSAAAQAQAQRERSAKALQKAARDAVFSPGGQFNLTAEARTQADKYSQLIEQNSRAAAQTGRIELLNWAKRLTAIRQYILLFKRMPTKHELNVFIHRSHDAMTQQLFNLLVSRNAPIPKQLVVQISQNSRGQRAGERFVGGRRGGGFVIPGARTAQDNVIIAASPGEAVLTDDGQRMLDSAAPGLLDHIIASQAPHFRAGGMVKGAIQRFAKGGRVPLRLPGQLFSAANDAFTQGFNSTPFSGAREDFIQGILSGGIFDKPKPPKNTGGQIPGNAPSAIKRVLQRMVAKANAVSNSASNFVQIPGSKPDAAGRVPGWSLLPDNSVEQVKGYTLASGITTVLRAGGFNVPITTNTGRLVSLAPLGGKGKYVTLYTSPRTGGAADATLGFANQMFGATSRDNARTGASAGVGWVSSAPSPSQRHHWKGYRRGGWIGRRLPRFAGGGFVGGVGQTGIGTASNVAFNNAIVQMDMAFDRMSFGTMVGLENQFRRMVTNVQSRLRAALAAGDRRTGAGLQRELDRLQIGLQAVEFAVGERIKSLTDQVAKIIDRVGRVDQTAMRGIGTAMRLTARSIRLYQRAIREAVEAHAPKDVIDQLTSSLRDIRDTRRQVIRAQYQTPIDIAEFRTSRAQARLQRLELQQRIAGTYDTGGVARAGVIRSQVIPDLQRELHRMQIQLNNRISKGTLTADEKRQAQLAIDQKRNEILQEQLDAQELTAANTSKIAQHLTGGLAFEFQNQQFTDILNAGTGM